MPVNKSAGGILYKGQLLRQLTPDVAVKYMLRCLPALREFNDECDGETRELILTTAVILRQFEEIDDDDEHDLGQQEQQSSSHSGPGRINFLSVINAVLRSSGSEHLFRHSQLLGAAYWINLRQEVYFALRKGYAPETVETPQQWIDVNPANKLVVHANRVVKWLYSGKSREEWCECPLLNVAELMCVRLTEKSSEAEGRRVSPRE
jgi:hypothetical protein